MFNRASVITHEHTNHDRPWRMHVVAHVTPRSVGHSRDESSRRPAREE